MPKMILVALLFLGCASRSIGVGSQDAGADLAGTEPVSWTVPTDAGTVIYNLTFPIRPVRKLDLVFMLDASPSMAAKQQKLAVQFPKFITAIKDPNTGALPDLRVAIMTSDLGTGGIASVTSCDTGLDGSIRGNQGRFQFINPTECGVTDTSKPWLFQNTNANPIQKNYAGDFATVFGCLASAVGSGGCGFSQPLQALESAFFDPSNVALQRDGFLRPDAILGIVIITDQDDCSDGASNEVFVDTPGTASEALRLRCTTRASSCDGQNLSNSPPGYPTTAAFSANFTACATRTDFCGSAVDTTQPTDCNPLADYRVIADELKQLKSDPDNQIAVAGIFGWPRSDADMATAQLIIDLAPNPDTTDTAHPQIFDDWPICYDQDHPPAGPATGFDQNAASWGARPGLRLSAFIDEFAANGLKFSICQSDNSAAMAPFGISDDLVLHNLCITPKLLDTDVTQPDVQASCKIWLSVPPVGSPSGPYTDSPPLPQCDGAHSVVPCWQVVEDHKKCPDGGRLFLVFRESGATTVNEGTLLNVQCQVCPDSTAAPTIPGCAYGL